MLTCLGLGMIRFKANIWDVRFGKITVTHGLCPLTGTHTVEMLTLGHLRDAHGLIQI